MAAFKPVGYALIGLGKFAQNAILPGFRHSKKAKLVALVSSDTSKAKRLAKEYRADAIYTYAELPACFSNPQVEAVYVATNIGTHAHYTVQAANAGKHVLCEKTMASSVQECQKMIDACRASNRRLMIAYRKYFEPSTLALKKLITSGKLGRLKFMHSAIGMSAGGRTGPDAWILDAKDGGGVLPEVGVYCVNTLRWLVGKEPVEVSAYPWTTNPEAFSKVDENVTFRLNFPGGLVALATASFGVAVSSFVQVHGEKGWAALTPAFTWRDPRCLSGKIGTERFEKKFKVIDELSLELDHLADSIRRKRDPEPDGVQGMRDVAVMEAIYRSAREGRTIPIVMPG